ncbi:MAG: hypothetical protein KJO79_02200 [Verrucomicrobiae bacterium]|nr:hypothetical protein [Verrucomicrobiae bacterium]NNJ85965.1 hypothetical protein [Akkermansiaceae bacterium]
MKNNTTTMIVAMMLGIFATTAGLNAETDKRAERARSLYHMGITAMNQGNFALAKTSFREVLRIYPNHPQARAKLIHLTANRNNLEISKRKAELRKVIIPKVDLDKASVKEALEMLGAQVERESKNKVTPNFIVQDPTGAFNGPTVTLRLNRIPAETLLRYIVDQVRGNIRYDNHAIVITPRQRARQATQPKGEDSLLVE